MARRRITVEGREYEYEIGVSRMKIRFPGGGSRTVDLQTVNGATPDQRERGRWKVTGDGMVTPRDVENWIRTVHLGLPPRAAKQEPAPLAPEQGDGSYWIRFKGIGRDIAALWSQDQGWRIPGSLNRIPESGITAIVRPMLSTEPRLYMVQAWRAAPDALDGNETHVVGLYTDPRPAKELQTLLLNQVADEMRDNLGRRPDPYSPQFRDAYLDMPHAWRVEIHEVAVNKPLVDLKALSAYPGADAQGQPEEAEEHRHHRYGP